MRGCTTRRSGRGARARGSPRALRSASSGCRAAPARRRAAQAAAARSRPAADPAQTSAACTMRAAEVQRHREVVARVHVLGIELEHRTQLRDRLVVVAPEDRCDRARRLQQQRIRLARDRRVEQLRRLAGAPGDAEEPRAKRVGVARRRRERLRFAVEAGRPPRDRGRRSTRRRPARCTLRPMTRRAAAPWRAAAAAAGNASPGARSRYSPQSAYALARPAYARPKCGSASIARRKYSMLRPSEAAVRCSKK